MPSTVPTPAISPSFLRRFTCALALLPLAPATATLVVLWVFESASAATWPRPWLDEWNIWQGCFSLIWVAGLILLWRSFILWTLGRKGLTTLISFVPFIQIAWAQPLWTMPGCRLISDEVLRLGQHQLSAGAWVWLVIWAWWGAERTVMSQTGIEVRRLGRVSKRLIACIGMFPFVFGAFMISMVAAEDFITSTYSPHLAMVTAAIIAVIIWLLIWRPFIPWSPVVLRSAVLRAALLIGVPIAAWAAVTRTQSDTIQATLVCAAIIGWGVWMIWTVGAWPLHIDAEPATAGPLCPACGYSLRGLKSTRCPECGSEPTLDELWAAAHHDRL